MRIALFEPESAGNVGAVLIEPMGFEWDDRRVRRTAMDYIDHVDVTRHADFEDFQASVAGLRLVLFTTRAGSSLYDFRFDAGDVLLFGKESAGVTEAVARASDAQVRIPMRAQVRSLNLATSAALALGEALRQTGGLPG